MRLAPLIMAGVTGAAAVGGVGLIAPSPRRRTRSEPDRKARLIGGVMLISLAAILSIFSLALAGLLE